MRPLVTTAGVVLTLVVISRQKSTREANRKTSQKSDVLMTDIGLVRPCTLSVRSQYSRLRSNGSVTISGGSGT